MRNFLLGPNSPITASANDLLNRAEKMIEDNHEVCDYVSRKILISHKLGTKSTNFPTIIFSHMRYTCENPPTIGDPNVDS